MFAREGGLRLTECGSRAEGEEKAFKWREERGYGEEGFLHSAMRHTLHYANLFRTFLRQ